MATRRELTKAYAREYQRASKKAKGVMLDELCAATGWSRVNARRAIREAAEPEGPRRAAATQAAAAEVLLRRVEGPGTGVDPRR